MGIYTDSNDVTYGSTKAHKEECLAGQGNRYVFVCCLFACVFFHNFHVVIVYGSTLDNLSIPHCLVFQTLPWALSGGFICLHWAQPLVDSASVTAAFHGSVMLVCCTETYWETPHSTRMYLLALHPHQTWRKLWYVSFTSFMNIVNPEQKLYGQMFLGLKELDA